MPSPKPPGTDDETANNNAEAKVDDHELANQFPQDKIEQTKPEKNSNLTPILIAVWTAVVAAFGNGAVSWFNGQETCKLESEKAQSAVILEVVKTSPDRAANNLAILVDIGVINEEQTSKRLREYLKTRAAGQGPSIPVAKDGVVAESTNDASCSTTGDYVVVNVHWGDDDGGLNIRTGPNQTQLGVIPATGTGIDVGTCRGGWCQVHYKCASGWAFAQHLALRATRLSRVTDTSTDIIVRRDPGVTGVQTGTLTATATDIVRHVCQPAPLPSDDEWCQVSAGKISGWVPAHNLEAQTKQNSPSVTSAATAPPRPE